MLHSVCVEQPGPDGKRLRQLFMKALETASHTLPQLEVVRKVKKSGATANVRMPVTPQLYFKEDLSPAALKLLLVDVGSTMHVASSLKASVFATGTTSSGGAAVTKDSTAVYFRESDDAGRSSLLSMGALPTMHRFTSFTATTRYELTQVVSERHVERSADCWRMLLRGSTFVASELRGVFQVSVAGGCVHSLANACGPRCALQLLSATAQAALRVILYCAGSRHPRGYIFCSSGARNSLGIFAPQT